MKRKGSVSVSMIARKAGVSPATVSRVLHGGENVSEEKRELVRAALDSAKGMPRMRGVKSQPSASGTVAVLIVNPDGLHASSIDLYRTILAVEEALRKHKLNMIFSIVDDQATLPEAVTENRVDALLLAGTNYPPRLKSIFERLPSVWLTSHHEGQSDFSLAGNEEIGRMAADYLVQKGHRTLAYFQIPEDHPVHHTRGEFFEFTAMRAGARVQRYRGATKPITGSDFEDWEALYAEVLKQVRQFQKTNPMPTGVFIPFGMLTGLAYRAFSECGLKPGRDLDVVCCEQNMPLIASLDPQPACIQIDALLMAQCAVEEVARLIGNPQEKRRPLKISVAPRLHIV